MPTDTAPRPQVQLPEIIAGTRRFVQTTFSAIKKGDEFEDEGGTRWLLSVTGTGDRMITALNGPTRGETIHPNRFTPDTLVTSIAYFWL